MTWPKLSRRPRGRSAVPGLLVLAFLGGCGGSSGMSGGIEPTKFEGSGFVSRVASDARADPVELSGELVGGGSVDLGTYRGKVVVLNLWGSWCAPCRGEAPDLQATWAGFSGRPVQFLGINTQDDDIAAARAFEAKYGVTYPSLRDPDGKVQLMFRRTLPPKAIPSTLVLDASGRIAARVIGATSQETLRQIVNDLLSETGKA